MGVKRSARVPSNHIDDDEFNLGGWVSKRRSDYKNNRLEPERIQQLEEIESWVWDPVEADFQYGLGQLKKYVEQKHNAKVPARYIDDDDFNLGAWINSRRNDYKNKKLGPNRIQLLEDFDGWVWTTKSV